MHKASTGVNDIKLLVLDIDGTITGDSNTLSVTVKEVIAAVQAKGIKVAIAYSRPLSFSYHTFLKLPYRHCQHPVCQRSARARINQAAIDQPRPVEAKVL